MSAPRVFFSYSHDSQDHKNWVLTLATRMVRNGVDVIRDQWDLSLGGDLPHFMESNLTEADRILAICTAPYVAKANAGHGGVGYEKMILTARLMKNLHEGRIIPMVRSGDKENPMPTFLGSKLYIDFRADELFEQRYAELLREIHGEKIAPRPPLGNNPFKTPPPPFIDPRLSFAADRYVSAALSGTVTFDYSNNNGCFIVGSGDMVFETAWSGGSNTSVHAYRKSPSIRTIALAFGATVISDISDASEYDTSSRVRTPKLGEIVVWQNTAGYYLATKIEKTAARSHGAPRDELIFSYMIAPGKSPSFRSHS